MEERHGNSAASKRAASKSPTTKSEKRKAAPNRLTCPAPNQLSRGGKAAKYQQPVFMCLEGEWPCRPPCMPTLYLNTWCAVSAYHEVSDQAVCIWHGAVVLRHTAPSKGRLNTNE